MKKIMFVMASLILILSMPLAISLYAPPVYAATIRKEPIVSISPTPKPLPAPARVEYALPYPGMLPDNPLYILKKVRDSIIELLISNPVNKAEFYVLQADKKLNMGISLSALGKKEEANEIFGEALVARTQAVGMLEQMSQTSKKIPAFVLEKMTLSLSKHKEVLIDYQLSTDAVGKLITRTQALFTKSL